MLLEVPEHAHGGGHVGVEMSQDNSHGSRQLGVSCRACDGRGDDPGVQHEVVRGGLEATSGVFDDLVEGGEGEEDGLGRHLAARVVQQVSVRQLDLVVDVEQVVVVRGEGELLVHVGGGGGDGN